ncbi:MAG: glucose 1-dehydrogenase [Chloroflexi bacterium]|nr:MAG: glucose 1-dehydrogenase [Chloroflexota bacterium]
MMNRPAAVFQTAAGLTRASMKLENKVAIVTGGAKGIGRAACLALAREGACVSVNYSKSEGEAADVVRQIEVMGRRAIAVRADVSQDAQARALIDQTVGAFGRLDVLVNNAGWTRRTPHNQLDLLSEELLDRTLSTNVKGPLYCIRAAVPHMQQAGAGSVVNITSVAGIIGQGSSIVYCGSKAALAAMTRALARAFAPVIRFNSVAPGFVDTGFVVPQKAEGAENARRRVHLGRIVEPEDIAAAVLFFCTDGSALTGEEIVVDGGIVRLGARQ